MAEPTSLLLWDVRVRRKWSAVYTLGIRSRIDLEPDPPVSVEISAEFDNDHAAREFERKVRELLDA